MGISRASIGAARPCSIAALKAPDRWSYTRSRHRAAQADEFDALDLYHATSGGEAALKRKYRDDAIRAHGHVDAEAAPKIAAE